MLFRSVSPEHHGLTSYPDYYLLYKFVGKNPGQFEEFTTQSIHGKNIILGSDSFRNNEYITKLTITGVVNTYYAGFASNCKNLKEIKVTGGVQFTSNDGVMYYNPNTASDKNVRLYLYPAGKTDETFTLGENVRIIRSYAFEGAQNLKTVVLNNGLEKIESYSFRYSSLESITIPSNVDTLGINAFERCEDLVTVNFGNNSKIKTIRNNTFLNCTSLENIAIPSGVTSIGDNAFKGCTSLETITIPASVTSIGKNAFEGCTNLKNIIFEGDKIATIQSNTFKGCSSLESIAIPDSVLSIGANAFEGCTDLKTISIPITINITKDIFKDCENLANLTLTKGTTGIGHDYSEGTYEYTPWNQSTKKIGRAHV